MDAMKNSSGKPVMWENETVSTALKIRCATGVQGYKFLCSLGYPLPSYRTLCRRIVSLDFAPGIQHTVLEWMQFKGVNMTATEKLCSLMLDEIQIAKAVDFDPGLHRLIGYISSEFSTAKEPDSNVASHIICFMVKGITTKWKQLIAYFYTGMSVAPYQLWGMIKQIICHLGECEYKVVNVVSDMASSNQGMWKEAGVITNRFQISPCVVHPYFANENLYFMADVPHLLKNLRSAVLKYDLELPKSTVEKYNLPTSVVSSKFFHALVELQDGKELKLAPKLARKNVNPSHYEKMRVNTASQLLSHTTASALRTLVAHKAMDENALTTAFFCEFVNNWFDITNCRHMGDALFENSEKKVELLSEALNVIQSIKFVGTGWKPVQSGLQLSTTSILCLHKKFVINGKLIFLMAGRLTQDALENLFSQVRGKGVQHPKPTQFRVAVKLISVSQFMTTPTTTNYDNDDTPHLLEFIKTNLENQQLDPEKTTSEDSSAMEVLLGAATASFDTCEADALYYLTGWAVYKEVKKQDCEICKDAFVTMDIVNPDECPHSLLTLFRSYTHDKNLKIDSFTQHLCHPSKKAILFLREVETIFRANVNAFYNISSPVTFLTDKVDSSKYDFPSCHNAAFKILKRFLNIRLNIHAKEVTNKIIEKQFASKAAARAQVK
uniref:uncharacterized protein LOC120348054 n=1 Tax=Styela clava TaxID=7725 RepID=UPI001939B088|nr:uncharacterized protein LOC120348054 [Styela clava]